MTETELEKILRSNPDLGIMGDGSINRIAKQVAELPHLREHDLQVAIIQECDRRALGNPLYGLLFAIPNGGQRSKAVAGKLKAEGVRAGIPDLMLPVARQGCHGLFLELKVRSNKPSMQQIRMIDRLKLQGYCATVVWELRMALNLIAWYLEGK